MLILEVPEHIPSITDWLTAIAALIGVPLSLWAFVKLIIKDKDKQIQIDKLSGIAAAQVTQAEEMVRQTAVMVNQAESLSKQNDLIAQQIDVLRNTAMFKNNDNEAVAKLQVIEEQRLRLSVKPRLWLNGAGYKGYNGEMHVDLNNKGEVAHLDNFNLLAGDIVLHSFSLPFDLEKGGHRNIYGRSNGAKHIMDTDYTIEILYHDALNHHYRAVIKGKGASAKLVSDESLD